MVTTLRMFDETASGERTEALVLELERDRITVRELIERRVREEVAAANATPRVRRPRSLVAPSPREAALNPTRRERAIDADRQVEVALKAFEGNGFFLLVDDRQLTSLDDEIDLLSEPAVSFLRLVPLVGG